MNDIHSTEEENTSAYIQVYKRKPGMAERRHNYLEKIWRNLASELPNSKSFFTIQLLHTCIDEIPLHDNNINNQIAFKGLLV